MSQSTQRGCGAVTSTSMSDLSSGLSSPEEAESDTSEGMGEEEGTSAGKDDGTCEVTEKAFAGAKSASVKTWGLKG